MLCSTQRVLIPCRAQKGRSVINERTFAGTTSKIPCDTSTYKPNPHQLVPASSPPSSSALAHIDFNSAMTIRNNQSPSLYPEETIYNSKRTDGPSAPPPPPPAPSSSSTPSSAGTDSATYDLLLEIPAILKPPHAEGLLRVLQFLEVNSYHAFLSLQHLNIPLLPSCPVYKSSSSPHTYELHIPSNQFTLIVSPEADKELVTSLEQILKWFCQWNDAIPAGNIVEDVPASATTEPGVEDRFTRLGDKGVRFVETMGERLNAGLQRRLSKHVESARGAPQKDLKLGGGVTKSVLSGTRVVVGVGANVASKVTGTVSGVVGKGLAKNPMSKNMSRAPEGSARRKFHDNLMGGLVAFGRVYVAADQQGKLIIQTTTDASAELAGVKYGHQAEHATRNLGSIALDGYRVARFPAKLGTVSLLKGGLKSCAKKGEGGRESDGIKARGRSKSERKAPRESRQKGPGANPDTLI